jgi:hypothetical protein
VIRDRKGPDAPTCEITICSFTPVTEFINRRLKDPADFGSDGMRREFRVQVHRQSPGIVAFDVRLEGYKDRVPRSYVTIPFRAGDDRGITFPYDESNSFMIYVRGVSALGVRGEWAQTQTTGEGGGTPPWPLPLYSFEISLQRECVLSGESPDDPPHHTGEDMIGKIIPVDGWISFDIDVREWRIYRRVGRTGPISLIAKDQGKGLPNPSHWQDDHLPSEPGTLVCYYAQAFDENGNPSPLQRLECIVIDKPDLAVPMLEDPKLKEDLGNGRGRVQLSWFCDPTGADRFEILVATADGTYADPVSSQVSQRLSDVALTNLTDNPAGLLFYPYQTQRLDGNLGSGPEFSVVMEVPIGKVLYYAVRAVGTGDYEHRPTGGFSNVVSGAWSEPPAPSTEIIPWPARPFPSTYDLKRDVAAYGEGEGPYYAMQFSPNYPVAAGVFIGLFRSPDEFDFDEPGSPVHLYARSRELKPEDYVFDLRPSNNDAGGGLENLMPFMLYRYQLPGEAYPDAVPNVVQCTPLIDRFAWKDLGWDAKENAEVYELRDPFLALFPSYAQIQVPSSGIFSRNPNVTLANILRMSPDAKPAYASDFNAYMFVVDNLPVVKGAKYQYIIVSFDKRGEIRRVIPVNPVQQ